MALLFAFVVAVAAVVDDDDDDDGSSFSLTNEPVPVEEAVILTAANAAFLLSLNVLATVAVECDADADAYVGETEEREALGDAVDCKELCETRFATSSVPINEAAVDRDDEDAVLGWILALESCGCC